MSAIAAQPLSPPPHLHLAHPAPQPAPGAAPGLQVLRTIEAMRAFTAAQRAAGRTVALVPTMGYLHAGHVSLLHRAQAEADVVVMSLFVNPTQFGPTEDLDRYPRDEAGDLAKAAAAGCAAVFMPSADEMYPRGVPATTVHVAPLSQTLCATHRPTHFGGVCLVVNKLFNIVGCDVAVFGEKDYQQLAVIRRMVRDLDLPVRIVGAPLVREADGLALSSRNVYLTPAQRHEALALSQGLQAARIAWLAGERDAQRLEAVVAARLAEAEGGVVDYCQAVDAEDLSPVAGLATGPVLLAVAVRFGHTRLIDNTVLG